MGDFFRLLFAVTSAKFKVFFGAAKYDLQGEIQLCLNDGSILKLKNSTSSLFLVRTASSLILAEVEKREEDVDEPPA